MYLGYSTNYCLVLFSYKPTIKYSSQAVQCNTTQKIILQSLVNQTGGPDGSRPSLMQLHHNPIRLTCCLNLKKIIKSLRGCLYMVLANTGGRGESCLFIFRVLWNGGKGVTQSFWTSWSFKKKSFWHFLPT